MLKERGTGVKYYTQGVEPEEGIFYITMDTTKPSDRMLGRMEKLPQGDEKTMELCYLDPDTFCDKLNDIYTSSLK